MNNNNNINTGLLISEDDKAWNEDMKASNNYDDEAWNEDINLSSGKTIENHDDKAWNEDMKASNNHDDIVRFWGYQQ